MGNCGGCPLSYFNIMTNCIQCGCDIALIPLRVFCSTQCENAYWANPYQIKVTTVCPTCGEKWSRLVYAVQCLDMLCLEICPNHGDHTIVGVDRKIGL